MTASIAALLAPLAQAQPWPSRPLRVIVPFPPGNAGDLTARTVSDRLAQRLGQPVVVDNRPGAAGVVGMEAVARATPDGYTVVVTSLSPVVIIPVLSKGLPYDPQKDFVPVARIAWTGMMLVASPSIAARNVGELITHVRANPGRLNYGHLGSGTLSQLSMELFKLSSGTDVVGVPYKGSAQALTDILGGQIQLMFDGMTSANPQVKAGKLKAFAVTSKTRSVFAPDVPTLSESGIQGLQDVEVLGWTGLLAPAGTPRPVVDRINADMNQILQQGETRERFAAQNLETFPPASAGEFGEFIRAELAKWAGVARAAKIESAP
jgi:tripartite-type tricarboxylate transporter receptor subunit TctC